MYIIKLGTFLKRVNSTKQPDVTNWTQFDVYLKQAPVSYDRPQVLLEADFTEIKAFNYAQMFGRFYYVARVTSVRTGLVELQLTYDILANCKAGIIGTKAFIEYGANTFNAGDAASRLSDNRRPIIKNPSQASASVDPSGGVISPDVGTFIVQAVGNNPNGGHEGLATFALTANMLRQIIAQVNTTLGTEVDDILNDPDLSPEDIANALQAFSLKQSLLNENAMAAIKSVLWVPLSIAGTSGTNTLLYLGNYSTGIVAGMLTQNSIYTHSSSISIPWPVSDWRRNNCQMTLYLPFFGSVPVPVDQCLNIGTLNITWTEEYFSGSISVKVDAGSYNVYSGSTNIAVEMGIGSSRVGISQLLGGGVQMLGGALQFGAGALDAGAGVAAAAMTGGLFGGSNIASGAASMASGAQDMLAGYVQTVQPAITSAGGMGGMAAIGQSMTAVLCVMYYPPITDVDFESLYGHPVFKVDYPAAGFCKTRGFSLDSSEESPIIAAVNTMMDAGVFIE